jgi:hypothetical protein
MVKTDSEPERVIMEVSFIFIFLIISSKSDFTQSSIAKNTSPLYNKNRGDYNGNNGKD